MGWRHLTLPSLPHVNKAALAGLGVEEQVGPPGKGIFSIAGGE